MKFQCTEECSRKGCKEKCYLLPGHVANGDFPKHYCQKHFPMGR